MTLVSSEKDGKQRERNRQLQKTINTKVTIYLRNLPTKVYRKNSFYLIIIARMSKTVS